MTKEKVVGDVPGKVLGMMADLAHKLQHGNITPRELEFFLKRKTRYAEELLEWERFYAEVFGFNTGLSFLDKFPKEQPGFNWLLVVLGSITAPSYFDICKKRFSCHCSIDLSVSKSAERPVDFYTIWVRDRVEADEENKNLSFDDCRKQNINGITLEERLLLELWYHWKTDKHLDINNMTLCSGSRGTDFRVPVVSWLDGRMDINWTISDGSEKHLSTRSVISL